MHRSLFAAAMAVVLSVVAVPGLASAGEKVIAFGGTGAWGAGFVASGGAVAGWFDYDGGFEFRLHPSDGFSLDFNFDISTPASSNGLMGEFKVFAHFHTDPYADKYPAVAPYIGVIGTSAGAGIAAGRYAAFLAGVRLGGEVHSPNHDFAFGIYGRPGIMVGEGGFGFSGVLELTWIVYPPIPRP